jgi:hypothetical protein
VTLICPLKTSCLLCHCQRTRAYRSKLKSWGIEKYKKRNGSSDSSMQAAESETASSPDEGAPTEPPSQSVADTNGQQWHSPQYRSYSAALTDSHAHHASDQQYVLFSFILLLLYRWSMSANVRRIIPRQSSYYPPHSTYQAQGTYQQTLNHDAGPSPTQQFSASQTTQYSDVRTSPDRYAVQPPPRTFSQSYPSQSHSMPVSIASTNDNMVAQTTYSSPTYATYPTSGMNGGSSQTQSQGRYTSISSIMDCDQYDPVHNWQLKPERRRRQ